MADLILYLPTVEKEVDGKKGNYVETGYERYAENSASINPIYAQVALSARLPTVKRNLFNSNIFKIANSSPIERPDKKENPLIQDFIRDIGPSLKNPYDLITSSDQEQRQKSLTTVTEIQNIAEESISKANEYFTKLKQSGTLNLYFPENDEQKCLASFKKLITEGSEAVDSYFLVSADWEQTTLAFFEKDIASDLIQICNDVIYENVDYTNQDGKTEKKNVRTKAISINLKEPGLTVIGSRGADSITLTKNGQVLKLTKAGRGSYKFCYKIDKETVNPNIFSTYNIEIIPSSEDEITAKAGTPEAKAASAEIKKEAEEARESAISVFGEMDIFDQQCILLKLIDRIVAEHQNESYANFVKLQASNVLEARTVTNILNGSTSFRSFINIPNHVISTLMPKIRLFKSYVANSDEVLKANTNQIDLEIPLEEFVDQKDILEGNIARGFGFGLKSFSWNNSSFNEVDRNIDANLVLKFANMDSFVQPRKGRLAGLKSPLPNQEKLEIFRFIELIYQVPSVVNGTEEEKKKQAQLAERFHIKIEVGWSYDDNILADLIPDSTQLENLKKAIDANTAVYYLFNKGHDLSFEKDGSITVTINYQSAQEARMNDERYSSIFKVMDQATQIQITQIEEEIKQKKQDLEETKDADKSKKEKALKDLEEKRLAQETKFSEELFRKFIDDLFIKKYVKLIGISATELTNFKASLRPVPDKARPNIKRLKDLEEKIYTSGSGIDEQEKIKTIIDKRLTEDGDRILAYITLGDLISLVSERINKINKDDKHDILRIMTGPYVYQKFVSEDSQLLKKRYPVEEDKFVAVTNIADIPVSFNYFVSWFEEEIIKKGKKNYTARNFFSNLLNKFLLQILRPSCFGKNFSIGNFKLDLNLLNVYPIKDNDPITQKSKKELPSGITSIRDIKRFLDTANTQIKGSRESVEQLTYIYLQILYTKQEYIILDEEVNSDQGMYHLRLGVDRGLVKEINFSRDDNKFLAPAIYAQQGAINPKVLAVPYNAEVSMIGNNMFKPGSLVYIDPTFALSTNDSVDLEETGKRAVEEMRLGGFYLITATKNAIESGKFSTNLTCRYVAAGKTKGKK